MVLRRIYGNKNERIGGSILQRVLSGIMIITLLSMNPTQITAKQKYKIYKSPTKKTFKSYEDADCITNSTKTAEGRLKKKYHLDKKTGVWKVGKRYCIAVGSYYTKKVGVKIDLTIKRNGKKYILKCITADCKADEDTHNLHRIHSDGSLIEFIVRTSSLSRTARRMGDVSYAGKQFKGRVIRIKVYRK